MIPTGAINYCKIRLNSDEWVKEGYHLYVNLPLHYKEITLTKLRKHTKLKDFKPTNPVEIPLTIRQFFTRQNQLSIKGISLFYDLLSTHPLDNKNTHMIKWERDLEQKFTWEQWKKAIHISSKSSACIEHWDNAQKILNRWYLTPYRLSKIYPSTFNLCWRCNDQTGNLLHILWNCKSLQSFWNSITSFIADLTGILNKLNPATALLGINLDIYPKEFRTIVFHTLIAARLAISSLWKSSNAPNLSTVIARINTQAQYELMLAYKNYSTITFRKKWSTCISHPKASNYLKQCNI